VLIGLEDHVAAAAVAEDLIREAFEPGKDAWIAARVLARCASMAEEDDQRPVAERKELALAYAERTMANLKSAVRNGYANAKLVREERWFVSIRDRDDYKQLLRELDSTGR
jgi:hypothetical protein